MKRSIGVFIVLAITLVALVVRLPGLGTFMTVDEESWMLRSGEFWHKLVQQGDPGGTFLTTHPGATTMWLAGAGIAAQEARLGFNIDTSNLRHFRLAATLPIAIATSLLIGLITLWLVPVIGKPQAIGGGVVLATAPFLTGLSQIVHLDALLALCMVGSLVCWLGFMHDGRWSRAIGASVLAGLALVTKFIVASWLVPVLGLIALWHVRRDLASFWPWLVRVVGLALGITVLTAFIAWPALWEKTDLTASFERDIANVVTQEHTALEISRDPIAPASFYLRTVAGRVPIHTLLLLAAAVVVSVRALRQRQGKSAPLVWFLIYAIGFLVLLTFAAKKADRYALPALAAFSVLAGWLGTAGWLHLAARFGWTARWRSISAGILVLLLVAVPLLISPHASAYMTPFGRSVLPLPQQGWGQGLEQAATWLNTHPLADQVRVASWYPSVMRAYFNGETFSLSSRHDDRVSYIVTYRNMEGREQDDIASNVLDELVERLPVHVVNVNNVPYAWIYKTDSLVLYDRNIGELTNDVLVGQTFTSPTASLSAIDIGFATFSSRANTQDVIVTLYNGIGGETLRTVVTSATDIEDRSWHRFSFEPLTVEASRELYITVTSPTSTPGDAVTVLYANADIASGSMQQQRAATSELKTSLGADIAYRLYP